MPVRTALRRATCPVAPLALWILVLAPAPSATAGDGPATAASASAPAPAPAEKVDFNFAIRPILSDRCFLCHGPDERSRKADLRLDRPEVAYESGAIVPGKPEESELVSRITADDDTRMPPKKSNLSLEPREAELLRRWVAEGAEYKPHWAFVPPPETVPLPAVKDKNWPAGPIDRFVLARLERQGLSPGAPASKEDWIRRVAFDLTGLPPTPGEVDAFLDDESPGAFAKAADRLLDSPRYGERMAMEWLDVARYADSFGYQADGDSHVWPWRDWVIAAFNGNLPYDRFLTWQVAGDLLDGPTREQRVATTFCRLNRMTNEGGSTPEEFRNEYVSDRVHTVGTAFLALTFECTRCHDHKYDPLTQKDYYGLGAFFNSIDEWGTYDNSEYRPTPTLPLATPAQERALAALSDEVEAAEARLASTRAEREGAFRDWLASACPDKGVEVLGLVGDYPLDDAVEGKALANRADAGARGSTSPANTLVPGEDGKALRLTGDDPARFPGLPADLDRKDVFTVAFRIEAPALPDHAVVFHRSAGTDTGFHGVELTLEGGRLRFALVRFWPGNAIAVRAVEAFPKDRWVHVAVSSDGSGRADGLRIYVDGAPAGVEIVRDRLTKDLAVKDRDKQGGLTFGERFRSPGLKGALIDEVRLYGRALAPVEVAQLRDGRSLAEAMAARDAGPLRDYYFAAIDPEAARCRAALREARGRLFAAQTGVFELMTMEETPEPRPAFILARGAYDAPRDRPVGRETPGVLPPLPEGARRDRLALARWLTDPGHPLTSRVAVNRYWQLFFGRGIVATADNFGLQGALPTHPELLDWLARDFIRSGWDVKRLCRAIVLSATYRQRSAASPALRARDPDNLLLARGPSKRLTAEMLRDAALDAGGLLAEELGGPPVRPYQPPGLWKGQNAFLPEYVPDRGAGLYRRSFYTFWRRTSPPPNMLAFDAPGREVCTVRRQSTNTPLQPLVLLNDPQFVEAARALGERMLRRQAPGLEDRLAFAFRLGATRRPTPTELDLLGRLYRRQLELFASDLDGARNYLKTGARPPAADLDPAELAAAAVTAGAILNLDAATTTR